MKLTSHKKQLLKYAKGHVLDVAAGTGENIKYYEDIASLVTIDASPKMCMVLARKIESLKPPFPVTVICGDASKMPFKDAAFNTVVSTLAICSLEKPHACMNEIDRLLKPGGSYMAIERGKIYYRPLRWIMANLCLYPNPAIPWHYGYFEDRDPLEIIASKFDISTFTTFGYGVNYVLVAKKPAISQAFQASSRPKIDPEALVILRYVPQD
ncbi:bifunctional S-adenosyl-L-methionine-dependent methyltransferase superfamily/Methyltransferase type 11 [Babesia duncani]|uniref:Bifunctional S-adenosyl-L-methionine-dependent methyltransferase superfamily/Methyltransferase type 11 n=1 Tax=Babesia duncani TaxID=323732 RepID=A0AAD9PJY0_9APIC|nr:bifunctional S-adenosyl-L-methionine-dependent methyltransferase superfamily/Methyltransferase type 11 [Babesia duncani]